MTKRCVRRPTGLYLRPLLRPGVQGVKQMTHQRLPRATAFEARGVILKDRAHSWSGVSAHDGNVVLAMRSVDIHIGDHGSSCLLWAPALEWVGGSSKRERLEHCEVAMVRGTAGGLVDYGGGG